jgi:hypothetical protein
MNTTTKTKMIPFNASKWTPDKKIVDRLGRPQKVFAVNIKDANYPVVGTKWDNYLGIFTLEGRRIHNSDREEDLFFLEEVEQNYRPWNTDEIPVGALIRDCCTSYGSRPSTLILASRGTWVDFIHPKTGHLSNQSSKFLLDEQWEHSIDNGKTWLPCGVLVTE